MVKERKRLNHVQHKQSGQTNYAEINDPTQAYINSQAKWGPFM